METRCPRWYQINVAALTLGELRRAVGGGLAFWLTLPVHLLNRLLRRKVLSRGLVPAEITVVERPEAEPPVPEALAALGFSALVTVSLPEFSGRNLVQMMVDEPREAICEFILAWSEEPTTEWSGANVVLASGLEDGQLLRTVASPQAYPTLPPPGHHVVLAPGLEPAALYARHREALRRVAAQAGSRPLVFDAERCIEVALRSHHELVAFQVERGVFVEAGPALVEGFLREQGLLRVGGSGTPSRDDAR